MCSMLRISSVSVSDSTRYAVKKPIHEFGVMEGGSFLQRSHTRIRNLHILLYPSRIRWGYHECTNNQ